MMTAGCSNYKYFKLPTHFLALIQHVDKLIYINVLECESRNGRRNWCHLNHKPLVIL